VSQFKCVAETFLYGDLAYLENIRRSSTAVVTEDILEIRK